MRWIIPDTLWNNFRLDRIIFISANLNMYGEWWYQWVRWEFYDEHYETYRWPTVRDLRVDRWDQMV